MNDLEQSLYEYLERYENQEPYDHLNKENYIFTTHPKMRNIIIVGRVTEKSVVKPNATPVANKKYATYSCTSFEIIDIVNISNVYEKEDVMITQLGKYKIGDVWEEYPKLFNLCYAPIVEFQMLRKFHTNTCTYHSWHQNGNMYKSIEFVDGKMHGEYKRWNSRHILMEKSQYENGSCITFKEYDRKSILGF